MPFLLFEADIFVRGMPFVLVDLYGCCLVVSLVVVDLGILTS